MTSKHQVPAADSTGLSYLSCFPPRFSLETPLLASILPLPANPRVSYTVWSPPPSHKLPDSLAFVEQARKKVGQRNASLSTVDSLLSSVHISGGSIALYVFAIGSMDRLSASQAALAELSFSGLIGEFTSHISVKVILQYFTLYTFLVGLVVNLGFYRIGTLFVHTFWTVSLFGRLRRTSSTLPCMHIPHRAATLFQLCTNVTPSSPAQNLRAILAQRSRALDLHSYGIIAQHERCILWNPRSANEEWVPVRSNDVAQ